MLPVSGTLEVQSKLTDERSPNVKSSMIRNSSDQMEWGQDESMITGRPKMKKFFPPSLKSIHKINFGKDLSKSLFDGHVQSVRYVAVGATDNSLEIDDSTKEEHGVYNNTFQTDEHKNQKMSMNLKKEKKVDSPI